MTKITFSPTSLNSSVNWSTPGIWSPAVAPNGADVDADIPVIYSLGEPYGFDLRLDGTYEIHSLTLAYPNALDIEGRLKVLGDVDASGRLFVGGTLNVAGDLNGPYIQLSGTGLGVVTAGTLEADSLGGNGSVTVAGALTIGSDISGGNLAVSANSLQFSGKMQAYDGSVTVTTAAGGFKNLNDGVLTGGDYRAGAYNGPDVLRLNVGGVLTTLGAATTLDLEGGEIAFFDAARHQYVSVETTLQTIDAGGVLDIGSVNNGAGAGQSVKANFNAIVDKGEIFLGDDATFTAASLTIAANATLHGDGTLAAPTTNDGVIRAGIGPVLGDDLVIDGAVSGAGHLEIDASYQNPPNVFGPVFISGSMELTGADSENVLFAEDSGTLQIDDLAEFTGKIVAGTSQTVSGPNPGALTIAIQGVDYSTVTGFDYIGDQDSGELVVHTKTGDVDLGFIGAFERDEFLLSRGPQKLSTLPPTLDVNVTLNDWSGPVACYRAGTLIRTEFGDVRIENLAIGDRVVTPEGLEPVLWLGRRRLDCGRHPEPGRVWPFRIQAHAFGRGAPSRDLWLSPGHAVAATSPEDGCERLVRIEALANGATIRQAPVEQVIYGHVELRRHAVIFAEGLPSESYLDTGNRAGFENAGVKIDAFPDFAPKSASDYCRPYLSRGAELAPIRAQLQAQAEALGWELEDFRADVRLIVDGREIPSTPGGSETCFALPSGAHDVRLRSRTFTPQDLAADRDDTRRLGVLVRGLAIVAQGRRIVATMDDAGFGAGFHAAETTSGGFVRWTNGDARLSASLWEGVTGDVALCFKFYEKPCRVWRDTRRFDRRPLRRPSVA